MRLSHSAVDKLMTCEQMYNLHYNEKIRPVNTSSALPFGSAFDKAMEHLLLRKEGSAYELFIKEWTKTKINKEEVFLPTSDLVQYFAKDYDVDIIDDKALQEITLLSGYSFNYSNLLLKIKQNGINSLTKEEKT